MKASRLVVTKIEPQKKNPARRSVFINGRFAFGLEASLLSSFHIVESQTLTSQDHRELTRASEAAKVKDRAYRLLALRPRSEKEIRDKLREKKIDTRLIEGVLKELKAQGFLDDQKFAQSWVESRKSTNPKGKFYIKQELVKKGVKKEYIEKALKENYPVEAELELAKALLARKVKRFGSSDDLKTKKRMMDFLLRRGFSFDIVRQAVRGLESLVEE